MQILEVKETILENNNADADKFRQEMAEKDIFYVNIMSSPGSGKTTTLLQTISRMKDQVRIGVMEADIDSAVDAETIAAAGVRAIQLHTGGMCHLSADMSRQGMKALGVDDLDLIFLENVGNLVCPAEFDTGAHRNVVILSIAEGHDKPLKYPLMFEVADLVLINKMDASPVFDFDLDKVKEFIALRNLGARVIPISARTGQGMEEWCAWLLGEMQKRDETNAMSAYYGRKN